MAPSKKTYLNLKLEPDLKESLQSYADAEGRSLGNLGEVLLKWAHEQLITAGDTLALKRSKVKQEDTQRPPTGRSKRVTG